MSKNQKRLKFVENGRIYKLVQLKINYPRYFDEGWNYQDGLLPYQKRMYKSWKHTRKHQWK